MAFALIIEGTVAQLEPAEFPVHESWTWIDVSGLSPTPQVGWSYKNGQFAAPPPPPAPPLPQQALQAFTLGLSVTSTANAALSGVYPVDSVTCDHVQSEVIALLLSNGTTFADGTASVAWIDMEGALHTFNAAQFKSLALAIGAYVAALFKVMNGTLSSLPPNTATIP